MRDLVFVVGDPLIDRYVRGYANHISPEAPVPVFVEEDVSLRPGGMLNAALNVKGAGSDIRVFGVSGESGMSQALLEDVFEDGECFTLEIPERTCQIKTRFMAQYGHMILRSDTPKDDLIESEAASEVVRKMIETVDDTGDPRVILISDYGCGAVTEDLIDFIGQSFPNVPIVVDPYPTVDPTIYGCPAYMTPNTLRS